MPKIPDSPRRTVLLTGATSGIGWLTALALAQRGHAVVAAGRNLERLAALERAIPGVVCIAADLADAAGPAALADAARAAAPALDTVIHNAAIQHAVRLDDRAYGATQVAAEIATNLAAPIELTRLLLPVLRARPQATLMYVTTGLALAPKADASVYCATKAGLHVFADSLRGQLRATSVRVIEVLPPLTDTPMTEGRGRSKASAASVAEAIVHALDGPRDTVPIGQTRLLQWLLRLAPVATRRLMLRSSGGPP